MTGIKLSYCLINLINCPTITEGASKSHLQCGIGKGRFKDKEDVRSPDKSAYSHIFFLFLNQNMCCGYSKANTLFNFVNKKGIFMDKYPSLKKIISKIFKIC